MLTVCLIAKNEGPNIEGCLASFRTLSENFLVVDTGSTDDTKEKATAAGAEVHDFQWIDDFSAARNFALEHVKTPWVMMVDADYRISEENAQKLSQFFKEQHKLWDVLDVRTEFDGSFAYLPKLWRTDLNLRYLCPVHEYLVVPAGLRRTKLDTTLEDPLPRRHHASREHYVKIMENYVKENPKNDRMLYYLVSDNRFLKNYKKAILWGQSYLNMEPQNDNQVARVLVHMGKALLAIGEVLEAEKMFLSALKFDSKLVDPYLCLGDLYFSKGDFVRALDCYFKASDCNFEVQTFHQSPTRYLFEPKKKLALTFAKLNEKEKAMQYAEEALKVKPTDTTLNELLHTLTQAS